MPVPTTAEALVALVRKSGLVDATVLNDFVGRSAADPAAPAGATELADRMVVMDRGEVVLAGAPGELDEAQVRKHLTV